MHPTIHDEPGKSRIAGLHRQVRKLTTGALPGGSRKPARRSPAGTGVAAITIPPPARLTQPSGGTATPAGAHG